MGSLGSAVWSDYIVDGDLAHEIDAREIPTDWKTGYVPLGKSTPYEQPRAARFGDDGNIYHLNTALVDWAFNLTKDTPLPDTPAIAARRMQYADEAAHRPPFVLRGDNLSASTFWHGKLLNQWARDWVKYQTDGHGTYAICGMEDTGTLQSLTWLAKAKKVDINRVLVLRTASNFDQQRPGITAAESLAETKDPPIQRLSSRPRQRLPRRPRRRRQHRHQLAPNPRPHPPKIKPSNARPKAHNTARKGIQVTK